MARAVLDVADERRGLAGQAQDLGSSWMTVGDLGLSARYLEAVRLCVEREARQRQVELPWSDELSQAAIKSAAASDV